MSHCKMIKYSYYFPSPCQPGTYGEYPPKCLPLPQNSHCKTHLTANCEDFT